MRKGGAEFWNERTGQHARFDFCDGLPGTPTFAYQVHRAAFDAALLGRAEAAGAELVWGQTAEAFEVLDDRARVHTDAAPHDARFVIDATGQRAWLGRRAKSLDRIDGFGLAAAYTHFDKVPDDARAELEATGNIHIFMVDDGWAWLIPQPGGRVSVGRVSARRGVRASDLDEAIGASPRIRRATEAAERLQSHLCGNYSYRNRSPYGVRHACVGDAAGFLDPCFSSGVAFAMLGAEWLVDALVPALAAGAEADPDLAAGASRAMDRGYRTMGALIERFYHAGLVDRLFFYDTPTPELRQGLISLLAGDLWRDDNPFERLLVSSRRRSGKGHDPRRPERA